MPSNLQALCYVCNAQKRDRDDTNFGQVARSYADRKPGCLFCDVPGSRVVAKNELAVAIRDQYPVTVGHTLVIPRRHFADYFDLYSPERKAVEALLHQCRKQLLSSDRLIDGFNVGVNSGTSAGQTIQHVHVHLIPRRTGDQRTLVAVSAAPFQSGRTTLLVDHSGQVGARYEHLPSAGGLALRSRQASFLPDIAAACARRRH